MVSVFKHVPVPAMANSSVRQRLASSGVLPGVSVHWIKVVMMASTSCLLLVRGCGGFLAARKSGVGKERAFFLPLSAFRCVCSSVCVCVPCVNEQPSFYRPRPGGWWM